MAIFLTTTLTTFTKVRFRRSFWSAQSIKILFGSKVMTSITIFFLCLFLQFCKKKIEKLPLINGHLMTISSQFSANYNKIFHKTEVQTVILMCFVYLYLNWIKSYNIKSVKKIFFSCLKMHYFRAILPK